MKNMTKKKKMKYLWWEMLQECRIAQEVCSIVIITAKWSYNIMFTPHMQHKHYWLTWCFCERISRQTRINKWNSTSFKHSSQPRTSRHTHKHQANRHTDTQIQTNIHTMQYLHVCDWEVVDPVELSDDWRRHIWEGRNPPVAMTQQTQEEGNAVVFIATIKLLKACPEHHLSSSYHRTYTSPHLHIYWHEYKLRASTESSQTHRDIRY